jgi:hypothetical protein
VSASDDYVNFADINFDGTPTGDGGAINVTLGSGPGDTIPWGLSLTRLLIGREQSIMSAHRHRRRRCARRDPAGRQHHGNQVRGRDVNATAALLAAIIIYGIRDGLLAW